jgi:AICAR transformylase/IMP cyclohydrolase PurH
LGAGGGPSTGEAIEVAITRARSCGHDLTGGAFAANAFFPFTDAPEILTAASLRVGLVPAGGSAEPTVRAFFAKRGVGMYYLPEQYRGFCPH